MKTRKQKIIELLKKHPNGLALKTIAHRLYGNEYNPKRSWSNYIGTYHCLRNHADEFERVAFGVYSYKPQPELKPDFKADPCEEIVLAAFKPGEKLRCNEIWHRIQQSGSAISYKTIFMALKMGSFIKEGIFYSVPE